MKTYRIVLPALIALLLAVAGCRESTDRSEGTVLLSVSNFDLLPVSVSLTGGGPFSVGTLTLRNTSKDPTGTTSALQDIELRSYEVRYRRRDVGSRVPPPTVQGLFGIVTVNSSKDITDLPVLFSDQILSQPLKDLLDFGVDRETGTAVVVLDVSIRFFGRTLSGDEIASEPATFTMEVTQ